MTPPYPHCVRDYSAEHDVGFVADSWLHSHHKGSKIARRTRMRDYRDQQRRRIHRILRRGVCLVAYDPDGPEPVGPDSHLLGYAVGERVAGRLILHYVYVKATRRKHGLATVLVTELVRRLGTSGVTYTHETYLADRIMGRKAKAGLDALWNPWLVWGEEAA